MTLEEFITKWLGKKADFDGYYGGQCVDLYRFYVKEVLCFPQSPGVGGAAEIWDTADPKYYDFITNTPTAVPSRGDIVVWNRKVGGGFGHVAIFLSGDVNKFTSLDQNWPTLDKVTETEHTYTNVIGWLRPRNLPADPEEVSQLKQQISDLEKEVEERKQTISTLEIEKNEEQAARIRNLETIAEKLDCQADLVEILKEIEKLIVAEEGLQKCLDDKRDCNDKYSQKATELAKTYETLTLLCGVPVASESGLERGLKAYARIHNDPTDTSTLSVYDTLIILLNKIKEVVWRK